MSFLVDDELVAKSGQQKH